jgi:molybdenum cofactor cytidylyltransferase
MQFSKALRISSISYPRSQSGEFETIAFVGAGGKSSALFQLARELRPPVIVSATTHLGVWQIPLADEHVNVKTPDDLQNFSPRGVTLVTGEFEGDRTKGLGSDTIQWLRENTKEHLIPLLIEADGSQQKPLKAPAEHEPPIPDFVQTVVVVAGLSGLGKSLDEETVFRPEIFARLSGLQLGEKINAKALTRVLTHPEGGLKNIPPAARRVVLLSQADTPELQAQAVSIAKALLPTYHAVMIASLKEKRIHAVREPIAGIVLAAGEAQRYGKPKQLLDWRGEPFVRAVARTALEVGLSPVIVVTGAYHKQVEATLKDLAVQIAYNEAWKSGQASSIRAGVLTLTPVPSPLKGEGNLGGGIFLLADQPQVTPTILHALVEEHATTLSPVIAPMVIDRRANPVLFDRVTFPDLMKLEGDMGGRGIFSKYKVTYLPWHDDSLLLDVDTPEHYQRLRDLLE